MVSYTVYPGIYSSTVSQAIANTSEDADIAANAQNFANLYGTCSVPPIYFNTLRQGLFIAETSCPSQYVGDVYPYSVSAHTFGSSISQNHAEALADAKLITDGKANANNLGGCVINPRIVPMSITTSAINIGSDDEVYGTIHSAYPVFSLLHVDYRFSSDGGSTWNGGTKNMTYGSTNTSAFYLDTIPSGTTMNVEITGVTPSSIASQIYNWNNNATGYTNQPRGFYFIKSGCTSVSASSVVFFGVDTSLGDDPLISSISQNYANGLADEYCEKHGQAYAQANGICGNVTAFPNDIQSGVFIKSGCTFGYSGSSVTYTVPAGTYISSISVAAANALALADVAANGQNYANSHGSCLLNANTILIKLKKRIDAFGLFDDVYSTSIVQPTGAVVHTGITVNYQYRYHAVVTSGLTMNIVSGSTASAEQYIGQFPAGDGVNVNVSIDSVSPTFDGTYYYIKQ